MVYGLVLLTLTCLTIKGYCGKKTSIYMNNRENVILVSLTRMLFCAVLGLMVLLIDGNFFPIVTSGMFGVCFLAGVFNAVSFIGWVLAIRKSPMVTVDVMLTIGSMLPSALCALFFGETVSAQKLFGYVLLLIAAVILSGYKKDISKKLGISGFAFALPAAVGNGMINFTQKLYTRYYSSDSPFAGKHTYSVSVYQFYTYVMATLFLLLIFAVCGRGRMTRENLSHPLEKSMPYILVMSICLFTSSYLQTIVIGKYGMPAQILYPVLQGGCLITVTCVATAFFGEKPTALSLLGSFVAFIGIVVINL